MAEPLKHTGVVYSEANRPSRFEFLPHPAIPTDYHINAGQFAVWNFLRRLMEEGVGDYISGGMQISVSGAGGTVTLSTGRLFAQRYFFNTTSASNWTHSTGGERWIYGRVWTTRTAQTVAVPGGSGTRDGVWEYRGNLSLHYTDAASYPDTTLQSVAGTGSSSGVFTASGSPGWTTNQFANWEVLLFDADSHLVGGFPVESNTASTLTIYANAGGTRPDITDAVTAKLVHLVLIGTTATDGSFTQELRSNQYTIGRNSHPRNGDTHTIENHFYVSVAGYNDDPTTGFRVLDVRDLEKQSGDTSAFDALKVPINFRVAHEVNYVNAPTAIGVGYQPISADLLLDWGIEGTGSYSPATDTFTITAGHDGHDFGANALVGYAFEDSALNLYKITANTASSSGSGFTVTIAPDTSIGQPEPQNGAFTIRSPAKTYFWKAYKYNADGVTYSDWVASGEVVADETGKLITHSRVFSVALGAKYRISLAAVNPSLSDAHFVSYQTYTVGVQGGDSTEYTLSDISVNSQVGLVYFSWDHPVGFEDDDDALYQFAYSTDGSEPQYTGNFVITSGLNLRVIAAEPGALVKCKLRAIDHASNVLSNEVTASGLSLREGTGGTPFIESGTFSATSITWNTLEDGVPTYTLKTLTFPYRVAVLAEELTLTSMAGSDQGVKLRIRSKTTRTRASTGSELTSAPSTTYDQFTTNVILGTVVEVCLERTGSNVTDAAGEWRGFFVYESSTNVTTTG